MGGLMPNGLRAVRASNVLLGGLAVRACTARNWLAYKAFAAGVLIFAGFASSSAQAQNCVRSRYLNPGWCSSLCCDLKISVWWSYSGCDRNRCNNKRGKYGLSYAQHRVCQRAG